MAPLMLESSLFPSSGLGRASAPTVWDGNRSGCISLAAAMCFDGGDKNHKGSYTAALDGRPNPISLAQAMRFEAGGVSRLPMEGPPGLGAWDGNQKACISLAQAMCVGAEDGSTSGSATPTPRDSNQNTRISLAQAMQLEGGSESGGFVGGSSFAAWGGNQNTRISLAQAMSFEGGYESSGDSGCDSHGTVRLDLAQMLDHQGVTCAPSGNDSTEASDDDTYTCTDNTIAHAFDLVDKPNSAANGIAIQAFSLHAAVVPPPGLGPLPLLLARHLDNEDSGDAKDDFLATPLPFVGCRPELRTYTEM